MGTRYRVIATHLDGVSTHVEREIVAFTAARDDYQLLDASGGFVLVNRQSALTVDFQRVAEPAAGKPELRIVQEEPEPEPTQPATLA